MVICAWIGCPSRSDRGKCGKSLSFFLFPSDKALRKLWERNIKRKFPANDTSRRHLCSLHFHESQFEVSSSREFVSSIGFHTPLKRRLKDDAVPYEYDIEYKVLEAELNPNRRAVRKQLDLEALSELDIQSLRSRKVPVHSKVATDNFLHEEVISDAQPFLESADDTTESTSDEDWSDSESSVMPIIVCRESALDDEISDIGDRFELQQDETLPIVLYTPAHSEDHNYAVSMKKQPDSSKELFEVMEAERALLNLSFKNSGKFMEDFDPANSEREKRKLESRKQKDKVKTTQMYDEFGLLLENNENRCDCLELDCPGCHFPCPKCSSPKCGQVCRNNRCWIYETVEIEGTNKILSWPTQLPS